MLVLCTSESISMPAPSPSSSPLPSDAFVSTGSATLPPGATLDAPGSNPPGLLDRLNAYQRLPPSSQGATLVSTGSATLPAGATLDATSQPGLLDRLAAGRGNGSTPSIDRLPPGTVLDQLPPTKPANPFDQFDTPTRAPNPFDQFDTPRGRLPPGSVVDQLPPDRTPASEAATPGFLDRIGGIAGRGIINGVTDIGSLAQAGGRLADRAYAATGLPDPTFGVDQKLDNIPISALARQGLDRQGFYQPTGAVGRAAEAAIEAGTGGALTGGASTGLLGLNAVAGATGSLAQSAGATPDEAAALSLGVGGVGAARSLVGNMAAARAVAKFAPTVTTDPEAAASVLRSSQMLADAKAATPQATAAQAATTVTNNLSRDLTGHIQILKKSGMIDTDAANTLKGVVSDAADPNHTGAGLLNTIDSMALPAPLAAPLRRGVADLNTISTGVLSKPAAGPLATYGSALSKYGAPVAAALAGLHSGDLMPVVEGGAALLGFAHKPISQAGAIAGGLLDRIANTRVLPGQAVTDAAQATLGGASPGVSPLDQLASVRSAYGDAQAQAQADATKAAQTNTAWQAHQTATNAAETTWQKALAQKAKQDASGTPDPLSSALWRDAENTTPTNLQAVTNSQTRGFQADQSALANRDASEAAAEAAMQARGRTLSDQAGNWLERQQVGQFKQANPGVPVTGAAALAATGPQEVFQATSGRFGSPADTAPPMNGFRSPPEAPSATPGASPVVAMPGSPPGPSATLQSQGMAYPPSSPGLLSPPSGGKALATIMHRQTFGGPAPTPDELTSAIDDVSADGLVAPEEADAAHAGLNVTPAFAYTIAHRVQAGRALSQPVSQDAASQATNEVSGLMGSSPSAGTGIVPPTPLPMIDRNGAAIRNPAAYQGVTRQRVSHADAMIALGRTPAEKAALSAIKNEPRAAGKQAIRDAYAAQHPGADMALFTSTLMRGV